MPAFTIGRLSIPCEAHASPCKVPVTATREILPEALLAAALGGAAKSVSEAHSQARSASRSAATPSGLSMPGRSCLGIAAEHLQGVRQIAIRRPVAGQLVFIEAQTIGAVTGLQQIPDVEALRRPAINQVPSKLLCSPQEPDVAAQRHRHIPLKRERTPGEYMPSLPGRDRCE